MPSNAAVEKHVPVYEVKDGKVQVTIGSIDHPMMDNHYIEWIALQTTAGIRLLQSARIMEGIRIPVWNSTKKASMRRAIQGSRGEKTSIIGRI